MLIPLSVPRDLRDRYSQNLNLATKETGRLLLFAADQKLEHLNDDFFGKQLPSPVADPEHLFQIAASSRIGAFATQLGLIARYGYDYRTIPYVVKVNGKSNLVPTAQSDPLSQQLHTVQDVVDLTLHQDLAVVGVGYTIYLGSIHEHLMLQEAARVVMDAHRHGLLAILWIYPRGKAVPHEKTEAIIAGAAGVGLTLGADFVKVNVPDLPTVQARAQALATASMASGRTGVICAGGPQADAATLCTEVWHQLTTGNTKGAAIGRNIFQRPLPQAQALCNALASLIIDQAPLEQALKQLKE